jgi:DNA-binding transcriptional regulator YdaS (Cro superfamily)
MAKGNIYVERRGVRQYAVVKPNAERASAVLPTQAQAIERAKEISPSVRPDVERVRYTSAGKPDQWRKG